MLHAAMRRSIGGAELPAEEHRAGGGRGGGAAGSARGGELAAAAEHDGAGELPCGVEHPAIDLYSRTRTTTPLTAQKDKTAVTVRWAAHDDNGDDLILPCGIAAWASATGSLLKDKISERYLSFDSALLPDGRYEMKVVASDAPAHTDADTLTGERVSGEFVVDTTPPVPGTLTAQMEGGKIHATFDAKDASSPIARAEYSVDAGAWQYLEPAEHSLRLAERALRLPRRDSGGDDSGHRREGACDRRARL